MDLAALVDRADAAHEAYVAAALDLAAAVAEVADTGAWHGDGARSLVQWMSWRWRLERADAARIARRAEVVADGPDLSAVGGAGALVGLGDLDVLAREGVLDVAAGLEQAAECCDPVGLARRLDGQRAERLLAEQAEAVERGEAASVLELQHRAAHERRRLTYRADRRHGTATISITGPLADLEAFREQLTHDARQRRAHEEAAADDVAEPLAAVLFDQLCHHDVQPPLVVVHTTADLLQAATPAGTPLPASVLERLLDDCRLEVHVDDPATGNVRHVTATERFVTGPVRRAVIARDVHCTWPGCTSPVGLHAHHIVEWPDGETVPENLTCLCGHHHRFLHQQGYRIVGLAPGDLTFFRNDGSVVRTAGQTAWTAPPWLGHNRRLSAHRRAVAERLDGRERHPAPTPP